MKDTLKKWWEDITYQEAKKYIRNNLQGIARDYVSIGYYLRYVRDTASFREEGYKSIHEFAFEEFGMRKSTVNHCIRINAEFSVDGNSPMVDPKYSEFGKAQLQELLYVPEEKRNEVTPDMTVMEIREIHKPERLMIESVQEEVEHTQNRLDHEPQEKEPEEEQKSFFGFSKTVRAEDSLINTPGCGNGKYDCFSCARPCGIRQEERYCVTATMGNPFPCTQMNERMVAGIYSDKCQHLHQELAPIREGDKEPVPCCKNCQEKTCVFRCAFAKKKDRSEKEKTLDELRKQQEETKSRNLDTGKIHKPDRLDYEPREKEPEGGHTEDSAEKVVPVALPEVRETVKDSVDSDVEEPEESDADVIDVRYQEAPAEITVESLLERYRKELEEWKEILSQDEDSIIPPVFEMQKIIVQALELLAAQQDTGDIPEDVEEDHVQPELPPLKNNEQRKEWLRNYREWGLWYEDEHIGAKYYRYCFENGAVLIAEEYKCTGYYGDEYNNSYLHLVGGPKPGRKSNGAIGWQWNEDYNRHPNSESELVEFLKFIQKEDRKVC